MGCTSSRDDVVERREKTFFNEDQACPICLNLFAEPVTLNCEHTMCSKCLQRYINNLDNTERLRGFPCPVCRKLIVIANPKTPRQTWVSYLKNDHYPEGETQNGDEDTSPLISLKHQPRKTNLRHSESLYACSKSDNFDPMIVDIVAVDVGGVRVVIVADFNNKSLKSMYTLKNKSVNNAVGLESNPFCVTSMSTSGVKVAITLPWSEKICLAEVNPDLRVVKTIKTGKSYYGICTLDEYCLAVSTTWQTPASVDVIDVDGKILNVIDTSNYGDTLFGDPWYITSTPSGDVLVADCQERSLLCVEQNGNVKWEYKPRIDNSIKMPAGVACDSEGSVYLVDSDTHSVIKLNEYGRYLTTILTTEDRPRCVYVIESRLLYVGMENGGVKIINLSGRS